MTEFKTEPFDTGLRHTYIDCECHSLDHTFCFTYFEDRDGSFSIEDLYRDELYIEIQMTNYKSFWKRAWAGIKYIFGYKSRYGHWDGATLSRKEAQKVVDLLNRYIHAYDKKAAETPQQDNLGQITEDTGDGC